MQAITLNEDVDHKGSTHIAFDRNSNSVRITCEWVGARVHGYSESHSVEEVRKSRVDLMSYFNRNAKEYYEKKVSKNSMF